MTWKLPLSVKFPNQLKSQHSIHLLHLALKTVDLAWKGLHSPEFEQNFSHQSVIYISRIHFFGCACLKKPLVARSWYSRVTSFTACWATHQPSLQDRGREIEKAADFFEWNDGNEYHEPAFTGKSFVETNELPYTTFACLQDSKLAQRSTPKLWAEIAEIVGSIRDLYRFVLYLKALSREWVSSFASKFDRPGPSPSVKSWQRRRSQCYDCYDFAATLDKGSFGGFWFEVWSKFDLFSIQIKHDG